MTTRILVVEDSDCLRTALNGVLSHAGYEITTTASAEDGLEYLANIRYSLVITDIYLGAIDGLTLLEQAGKTCPDTPVIIITSHASIDTAVSALRAGAYDYVIKPFGDYALLLSAVMRAVEKFKLTEENKRLLYELKRSNALLLYIANRDGMTGLYNHRYFKEHLRNEVIRAKRQDNAFSLIFIDVDHFKHYNDSQGHQRGDTALQVIGRILSSSLRRTDIPARYGGEEFAILLPETPIDGALCVAEKIRTLVAATNIDGANEQPLGTFTVSVGVAAYPLHADTDAAVLKAADTALYKAKKAGRNRVIAATALSDKNSIVRLPSTYTTR